MERSPLLKSAVIHRYALLLMGVGLIFWHLEMDTSLPLLINIFGFRRCFIELFRLIYPVDTGYLLFPSVDPIQQRVRKISFEGLHLFDTWKEIRIMGIWM
jgi:ABC-2 type transport system permease protein